MKTSGGSCVFHDFGLLLMRLMLAVVFVYHGGEKVFGWFGGPGIADFAAMLGKLGIPMPLVAAWLSGLTELVGGILLGFGFLTRLVAIPLAFNMYVAVATVHAGAFSIMNKPAPGMEYALSLAVFLTALVFTGPGRLSLDGAMCGRCCAAPAGQEQTPA